MADPRQILKERLSKELARGTPLRTVLDVLYSQIVSDDVRFALFGGYLRDLALGNSPRDIDLVAEGINVGGLEYALRGTIARRTSFGGLKSQIEGIPVDIWPVQDTWALRRSTNNLPVTLESLVQTTLLNIEGIVAILPRQWPQEPHFIDGGFFDAIERREIELNFELNPSPALSAARAIRVANYLGFAIGPKLKAYIETALSNTEPRSFTAVQVKHFGRTIVSFDEALAFLGNNPPTQFENEIEPFNLRMDFDSAIS